MITAMGLVAALGGPANERRARRASRIIRAAVFVFLWLAGLGFTALAADLIWSAWHANGAPPDSVFTAVVWYALAAWLAESLALLALAARDRSPEAARPFVVALRDLLGRHDDQLTPLARFQPAPDAALAAPPLPLTLRPVRFVATRAHPALTSVFWAFFVIGASASVCAVTTWPSSAATGYPWLVLAALIGFVALGTLIALLAYVRSRIGPRRRGPKVVLDDRGIHAGGGRGAFTLEWGQLRGLWQVAIVLLSPAVTTPDFTPALDANMIVYLADDGTAPLQWWLKSTASAAEVQASEALLRQIVARSGHPLRDATSLVYELVRSSAPRSRAMLGQLVRVGGTGVIGRAVHEALPQPPAERKLSPLTITAIGVIAALLAVANAALPLGELRLEHAHDRFTTNALATIRASRPIYATDFHDNGGIWRDYPSTDANFQSYRFAGGAYHLTGTLP
ncbi:MAG TPA: hypothetical protein VGR57_19780, partial [Ktedonobacterales bacterium]|nr:hypothetical protein [Ktedonobacterales bacterium]